VKEISPMTTLDMGLDKNDVLAIAVSRAELQLQKLLKDETDTAKLYDQQATKIKERIKLEAEGSARDSYNHKVVNLRSALKAFSSSHTVGFDVKIRFPDQHCLGEKYTLVTITATGGRYDNMSVVNEQVPFTEEHEELYKQYEAEIKKASEHKAVAVEIRRKLGNISTIERQMRARLAEAHLRQSADGEVLLQRLTGDLNDAVKALPGC
jgi:hypothetical protein